MEKFIYEGPYGTYTNCYFQINRYGINGNIAIDIMDDEGLVTRCTTNIPQQLGDDEIAVKDWSENEGMTEFLIKMGIIKSEVYDAISSGFVHIYIHKLSDKGLNLVRNSLKNTND